MKHRKIRPTMGVVLNAAFSMLGAGGVINKTVLDAFAGTGTFGLRALAQGARRVDFIERDARLTRKLAEEVKMRGAENCCRIIRGNALELIPKLKDGYDVLYIDPPYEIRRFDELQQFLGKNEALYNGSSVLFLEHSKQRSTEPELNRMKRYAVKSYGDSLLSVYRESGGVKNG